MQHFRVERLARFGLDGKKPQLVDAALAAPLPGGEKQFPAVRRPVGRARLPAEIREAHFGRVDIVSEAEVNIVRAREAGIFGDSCFRAVRMESDPAAVGRPRRRKGRVIAGDNYKRARGSMSVFVDAYDSVVEIECPIGEAPAAEGIADLLSVGVPHGNLAASNDFLGFAAVRRNGDNGAVENGAHPVKIAAGDSGAVVVFTMRLDKQAARASG